MTGQPFSNIHSIFYELVQRLSGTQGLVRFDKALYEAVYSTLQNNFNSGFGTLSVDYNTPDYLRQNMFEANIARFAAAKTHRQVLELNRIKNTANDFTDFIQQANALNIKYNKGWLKAEYDTAYSTGQTSADYFQQIDSKEYFPFVMFDTVGDQLVRDEHKALDGTIVKVGSREHNLINPPLGYNCRCRLRPLTDDEVNTRKLKSENEIITTLKKTKVGKQSSYDIMKNYGFDKNKAINFSVFDSNQYVKAFKESGLSYKDYGLNSSEVLKRQKDFYSVLNHNTIQWFNERVGKNGYSDLNTIRLTDYRNRPLLWNKKNFQFADPESALNTLQSPDEVWLKKNTNGYEKTYLKLFQNENIIVKTSFSKNGNETISHVEYLSNADTVRNGVKVL